MGSVLLSRTFCLSRTFLVTAGPWMKPLKNHPFVEKSMSLEQVNWNTNRRKLDSATLVSAERETKSLSSQVGKYVPWGATSGRDGMGLNPDLILSAFLTAAANHIRYLRKLFSSSQRRKKILKRLWHTMWFSTLCLLYLPIWSHREFALLAPNLFSPKILALFQSFGKNYPRNRQAEENALVLQIANAWWLHYVKWKHNCTTHQKDIWHIVPCPVGEGNTEAKKI